MNKFQITIKNLLKLIKEKLSEKADLNEDNTFNGNILVKNTIKENELINVGETLSLMNTDLLSKFETDVADNLYFNGLDLINSPTRIQKYYEHHENFDEHNEIDIILKDICTQLNISVLISAEVYISNKSLEDVVTITQSNEYIEYNIEHYVNPEESHRYKLGLNKSTSIKISGLFDYQIVLTYLENEKGGDISDN